MPGGGTFPTIPGQLTDDSELALSLSYGLLNSGKNFSLKKIASHYVNWYNSLPFDKGITMSNAFSLFGSSNKGNVEEIVRENALVKN